MNLCLEKSFVMCVTVITLLWRSSVRDSCSGISLIWGMADI